MTSLFPERGGLAFTADRTRDDPETAEGRIWAFQFGQLREPQYSVDYVLGKTKRRPSSHDSASSTGSAHSTDDKAGGPGKTSRGDKADHPGGKIISRAKIANIFSCN